LLQIRFSVPIRGTSGSGGSVLWTINLSGGNYRTGIASFPVRTPIQGTSGSGDFHRTGDFITRFRKSTFRGLLQIRFSVPIRGTSGSGGSVLWAIYLVRQTVRESLPFKSEARSREHPVRETFIILRIIDPFQNLDRRRIASNPVFRSDPGNIPFRWLRTVDYLPGGFRLSRNRFLSSLSPGPGNIRVGRLVPY
jgi:hypothetical protein